METLQIFLMFTTSPQCVMRDAWVQNYEWRAEEWTLTFIDSGLKTLDFETCGFVRPWIGNEWSSHFRMSKNKLDSITKLRCRNHILLTVDCCPFHCWLNSFPTSLEISHSTFTSLTLAFGTLDLIAKYRDRFDFLSKHT